MGFASFFCAQDGTSRGTVPTPDDILIALHERLTPAWPHRPDATATTDALFSNDA
jgi:hypothetical protein